MRAEPINIVMCVEELSLSGEISLGNCSKSAHYSAVRRINEYLRKERANWRVKGNVKDRSITAIPVPENELADEPANQAPVPSGTYAPKAAASTSVTLYRSGWGPDKWAIICGALDMDPNKVSEICIQATAK